MSLVVAHTSLLRPPRPAILACCRTAINKAFFPFRRLIGEDVWPVTAALSRGLWQVGNKVCQTLNLDCNLTVTVTPQGTVKELGLQELPHAESECSWGHAVMGREQHGCFSSHSVLVCRNLLAASHLAVLWCAQTLP